MNFCFSRRAIGCAVFGLLSIANSPVLAVYSCNVTALTLGTTYNSSANVDLNGTTTLTCTRASGDATTLTYRLKADNGLNFTTNRRIRRGATANYLTYYLRLGTALGGAATCGNSSNWSAPATGTTNVITGTLNFGAALTQSATWGYCLRVRGTAGGNPAAPTAGIYTDIVNIFAQYPNNDAGALTPAVPLDYHVRVGAQCIFRSLTPTMSFNYTSFSPTAQTASRSFTLLCSNAMPWTVTVTAPPPLLGLIYTIVPTPSAGIGTGVDQTVTLNGTIAAGQSGTCATSSCSASQMHTVTIGY